MIKKRLLAAGVTLALIVSGMPAVSMAGVQDTGLIGDEGEVDVSGIEGECEEEDVSGDDGYELKGPTLNSSGNVVWDAVYFGRYWQTNNNGDEVCDENDEMSDIKWRVLSVEGNKALLLANECLDCVPYNNVKKDITWAGCTLRSYLNSLGAEANEAGEDYSDGGFLLKAFSEAETGVIRNTTLSNLDNPDYGTKGGDATTDKVFLLSLNEATSEMNGFYDSVPRSTFAKCTPFAFAKGAYSSEESTYVRGTWWWLSTPGAYQYSALGFKEYGGLYDTGFSVNSSYVAVRPAITISLDNELWKYAGTVCSDGSEKGPESQGEEEPQPSEDEMIKIQYSADESVQIKWGPSIFPQSSKHYSKRLALLCAALSGAAEGGTNSSDGKLIVDAYNKMKMKSYSLYSYPDSEYNAEGDDFSDNNLAFSIAHKPMVINGKDSNLVIITARGSKEPSEFLLDKLTGKKYQGEFGTVVWDYPYDFRNDILVGINDYYKRNDELVAGKRHLVFLVTGHSLGGAAANLYAATLKKYSEDVYCYTFGAIDSIESNINDGYENIHNIFNLYDTFGCFGPGGWAGNKPAGDTILGKFGHMELFAHDYLNGEEKGFFSDDSTNHNIEQYLRAVEGASNQPKVLFEYHCSDYAEKPYCYKVRISCPIDVEIRQDGNLVGRVSGNEVDYENTAIPMCVNGEDKLAILNSNEKYDIRIIATDDGEMEYEISDFAGEQSSKVFENIKLKKDEVFESAVNIDQAEPALEEIKLYVVDESGEPVREVMTDGTEEPLEGKGGSSSSEVKDDSSSSERKESSSSSEKESDSGSEKEKDSSSSEKDVNSSSSETSGTVRVKPRGTFVSGEKVSGFAAEFFKGINAAKFVSQNKKTAAVSKKGELKAKKPGKAGIEALDGGGKTVSSCEVIVLEKPKLKISAKYTSEDVGKVLDGYSFFTTSSTKETAADRWESSNPSVAAVDKDTGQIKIVGSGKAKITAYFGNVKAKSTIKIK